MPIRSFPDCLLLGKHLRRSPEPIPQCGLAAGAGAQLSVCMAEGAPVPAGRHWERLWVTCRDAVAITARANPLPRELGNFWQRCWR